MTSPLHHWRAETGGKSSANIASADPQQPPVLVIVHGLGEHAGRYDEIAKVVNQHGWSVVAEDLLGHGRQVGKRGDADYGQLLEQVERVWREAVQFGRPRGIWGHSFGGNLVVNTLLQRGRLPGMEGALVTGPMFRAALPIPAWKTWAARWIAGLLPKLMVPTDIDAEDLSHDFGQVQAYRDDPLNYSRISARLGKAMLLQAQFALDNAPYWNTKTSHLPLVIWHGAEDRITDPAASRQFAQAAGEGVTFEAWSGGRHELHHEVFKDRFAERFVQLIAGWNLNSTTTQSL